jgi:hypothetical protein
MLKGRCLCGKVRYEIDGVLGPVVMCHCSICRRVTGSAFATNASVEAKAFRIVSGEKAIKSFESSKGQFRRFCKKCGSPLYGGSESFPYVVRVRLGSLEDAGGARPVAHIWQGSKSEWFEITDKLNRYEKEPPTDLLMSGAASKSARKKKKKK